MRSYLWILSAGLAFVLSHPCNKSVARMGHPLDSLLCEEKPVRADMFASRTDSLYVRGCGKLQGTHE